jgi:hypothetical protein
LHIIFGLFCSAYQLLILSQVFFLSILFPFYSILSIYFGYPNYLLQAFRSFNYKKYSSAIKHLNFSDLISLHFHCFMVHSTYHLFYHEFLFFCSFLIWSMCCSFYIYPISWNTLATRIFYYKLSDLLITKNILSNKILLIFRILFLLHCCFVMHSTNYLFYHEFLFFYPFRLFIPFYLLRLSETLWLPEFFIMSFRILFLLHILFRWFAVHSTAYFFITSFFSFVLFFLSHFIILSSTNNLISYM